METLPFDIILLIISKANLETRIQCRRVCKSWLAALSDPATLRSIPWPKCLLLHSFLTNSESRYIHLYSTRKVPSRDNAILKLRNHLKPTARDRTITMVGSCNGLVCEYHQERHEDAYYSVSNPLSTGSVIVPPEDNTYDELVGYGFGLSRETNEYKVVLLVSEYDQLDAMVVTIGIGKPTWRCMSCSHSIRYRMRSKMGRFVNGALHWRGNRDEIWVFDLENEQFSILLFPPNLLVDGARFDDLAIIKSCLSIVMIRKYENDWAWGWEIWALKDYNVKDSWVRVRQFKSYHLPDKGYYSWSESPLYYVIGFEPLMLYKSGSNKERTLCMRWRCDGYATMYASDPKDNTFLLINLPFPDFEVLVDYVPTFLSVRQLLSQR